MAGHSQFKNIMHRKGKQDAVRSKLFGKLAKEITVAAKLGLPDPNMNPRLRMAVLAARRAKLKGGARILVEEGLLHGRLVRLMVVDHLPEAFMNGREAIRKIGLGRGHHGATGDIGKTHALDGDDSPARMPEAGIDPDDSLNTCHNRFYAGRGENER